MIDNDSIIFDDLAPGIDKTTILFKLVYYLS